MATLHHEMDNMAMTDQELEDFLSFMDHPAGGVGAAGAAGLGAGGPLAALPAGELSEDAGTGSGGAAVPASSSDAHGSSEQHDSRMMVDHSHPSPGSSEDCGGAHSGRQQQQQQAMHMQVPMHVPHHQHQHQQYAHQAFAAAAPLPVPIGAAGRRGAGSAPAANDMLRAHSVQSLGSLTMPLEGLALGSPAVVGPLSHDAGAPGSCPAQQPVMVFSAGAMPSAFAGQQIHGVHGMPMVHGAHSMGAFAPFAPGMPQFVPGSAPPGAGGSLASTLAEAAACDPLGGGGGSLPAGGGGSSQALSTSWPSLGSALGSAGASPLPRTRSSGGAPKPPSSGGRAAAARGRGGAAAAGGDATYHRSSSGGGSGLSHSTIEKQRRDRLNALLDELGAMVPPPDGKSDGSRRPKHVILSDAIALLSSLQERLRLGGDEIAALRARLAAAEAAGGGSPGGGGDGCAAPVAGGPAIKPEPGSSPEFQMLPPTPSGTSPAELAGVVGMLRHASSDAELAAHNQHQQQQQLADSTVVVEQDGGAGGGVRVAVLCRDRDGLLGELVGALKATGATVVRVAVTAAADGAARDEIELRLEGGGAAGGGLCLDGVRGAVMGVVGGGGAAGGAARSKRIRQ
jgi:hypothetical protein